MSNLKFLYGTQAQIESLNESSPYWYDLAFYYPTDIDNVFYQAFNGELKVFQGAVVEGAGVTINNKVIGGVKTKIELNDTLIIPENYDYNTYSLDVIGIVNCSGQINIM